MVTSLSKVRGSRWKVEKVMGFVLRHRQTQPGVGYASLKRRREGWLEEQSLRSQMVLKPGPRGTLWGQVWMEQKCVQLS